jgi:hypothetical protein
MFALLAPAILLAGCARTEADVMDERALAEARPVGAPVSCVEISRIRHTRVRDDETIDFYMRGGEVYRNRLPSSCPGLNFEDSFSYRTSLGQLCSVDLITVNRPSGPSGPSCGLGRFQRIETSAR